MKYLIFAQPNCNHFLFLSFAIVLTIRTLMNEENKITEDIAEKFHFSYIYSLSSFLSIIPIIIINKRSESSKSKALKRKKTMLKDNLPERTITSIYPEYNSNQTKKKKKKEKTYSFIHNCIYIRFFSSIYTIIFFYNSKAE